MFVVLYCISNTQLFVVSLKPGTRCGNNDNDDKKIPFSVFERGGLWHGSRLGCPHRSLLFNKSALLKDFFRVLPPTNGGGGGGNGINSFLVILMSFYLLFIGFNLAVDLLSRNECVCNFALRFPLFPLKRFEHDKREARKASLIIRHQLHSFACSDKTRKMPDKASRANSVTPASERESERKESVDTIDEIGDEGFDDESCEDAREMRVRFKVRGFLRVITTFCLFLTPNWH